jgi:hypothetical protein
MGDQYNNLLVKATVPNALRTTTVTGIGVDLNEDGNGYQSALIVVFTGTITDGTHTVEVQESDVLASGYTAVAGAHLQGAEPAIVAADDDKIFEIGYLGKKRFVRVVIAAAGTTTGGVYGAIVILGDPRRAPVVRN